MKNLCLSLLHIISVFTVKSQTLCIQCFEQNDPISNPVTNLITNGGFESTNCLPGWQFDIFCPNATAYNCDITDWTCTGGDDMSYPSVFNSDLSVIAEGQNAAYLGNGNAFSCSEQWGDFSCYSMQSCEVTGIPSNYPHSLPGYGETTGLSLSQTVSGLTIGDRYVLEFWAGGEPLLGLLSEKGIFAVDVGFGKSYLENKPTGLPNYPTGTRFIVIFQATAASHTITFTNWGHVCDICTELVIDDVRLYSVEELDGSVEDCSTSVTNAEEIEPVGIYPNPFQDELWVDGKISGQYCIEIFDSMARTVMKEAGIDHTHVYTSTLASGMYYYRISQNNGLTVSGKLIKR